MKTSGRRTRAEVRSAKRVIKSRFGSKLDATVQAVFPFLFHRPLSPNALTVLGVFVSVAAAVALGMGALVLGGILLLAGGFFDLVDGVVDQAAAFLSGGKAVMGSDGVSVGFDFGHPPPLVSAGGAPLVDSSA